MTEPPEITSSFDDPYIRMRPSPPMPIACFYCGAGVPWFQCHCPRVEEIRQEKRAKPIFVPASKSPNGRPLYILDEEARTNSWLASQIPHQKPEPPKPTIPQPVDNLASTPPDVDTPVDTPQDVDRKAYQREWLRKKRAAAKANRAKP